MSGGKPSGFRPANPQYVIKLSAVEYRDFAKWMTNKGYDPVHPNHRRYRDLPKADLECGIEALLDGVADVYTNCSGSSRKFKDANDGDKIKIHKDNPGTKTYPVAVPREICENMTGEIDLDYLKSYVDALKNMSEDDAAYSLLGMYFLSRCR